MNLKGIQLVGFKSFADKTLIKFEEGVTCIVGPNGCGKSNISDAVRWVLGEKSAKNLRGGSMQDVIFGGTVGRKPLQSCEVSLIFDNTNRMFAEIDEDEVSMTRRLDRKGDSKYLINGQTSRQKDLVALFHTIGLGKEGYSIIGQGKVEQIMNTRPEDRRVVFEEALGLTNYKNRKEDIERKIEDANDNLYIFQQRIDEAERRLGPLSKQAQAAREYAVLAESLKVEEANTYIYRYENAEGEKSKYRKEADACSDKIINLNTRIEIISNKMEENRAKILLADDELSRLNDRRVELSVGNERKDGELKLAREKIKTYRAQIEEAEKFLEESKQRIGDIGDTLAINTHKLVDGGKRVAELETEIEVLRSAIASLDSRIAIYEKFSDESHQSQLTTAEEIAEMKKNLGSIQAQVRATKSRIDEVRAALKKAEERRESKEEELKLVRKDLGALRARNSSANKEYEEKQEEIRELEMNLNDLHQDVFTANGQIASLKDALAMYENLKNRFEGYKDSVRRLLSVAKTNPELSRRMHGVLADVVTTDQRYETAIETAIAGAMQNIVTPSLDDAKYLVEYLKRTNGGVITFLPVKNMRPRPDSREIQRALSERGAMGLATELVKYDDYYYNVVSNLLGNTLVCDNIASGTAIAKKYPNLFKIVTLDGDIVSTSGAVTGGSRSKQASSLLSHERKIQECKDGIASKTRHVEKLKQAIASAEAEKRELEAELSEIRDAHQDANSEIAGLTQREQTLVLQVEEAIADAAEFGASLAALNQTLDQLHEEEENSSLSEEQVAIRRANAEAERVKQKEQYEVYKLDRAQKSETLQEKEKEYASLTTELEQRRSEETRLSAEREELTRRVLDREFEKTETQTKLIALEEEEKDKELTEEERKAVEEIMDGIESLTKQKLEINEKQTALEEEKNTLQEEREKSTNKRYKMEMEITRIDTNLENIRSRMEEAYELDYEGCLPLRKEVFSVEESATLIATLKRKITALGAVNPHAVEEYDDEKLHCEEMVTQRDDLKKALEDLQSALDDVRGEMLRIFDQGFVEINENFKTTFKELFGGGKAELQLEYEEGEDPLAAGVDIVACPPGKALKKISLLSGGERALTAIAILFAILKTRPMPFCILDEIEAPLDDANVDRFALYLKKFVGDTQFIVITHRKPTMNQANTLFGVTMQEKGVSKIVSVRLSEIEQKLGSGAIE